MRIGIDYRMLSVGPNTVFRGLGRYTQQQLREVLRQDQANEYVLLCQPEADYSLILPEIRAASNVQIATIEMADLQRQSTPNQSETVLRYTEDYQQWLYRQHLDVYHATTPFLFSDVVCSQIDVCPVVATLYDFIPLLYHEHYLADKPHEATLYKRTLGFLRRADRLIAISQSARTDAIRLLQYAGEQIDIAYPIADPHFRMLAPETLAVAIAQLRRRLPIPHSYVLCVAQWHYSKNVEALLTAYTLLPDAIRAEFPLVIVGQMTHEVEAFVRSLLRRYRVTNSVVLTNAVDENELVALYNSAAMIIHPSWYEGFGLPILEAMRCGTPVICSNSSSMPEVAADAALYVDPSNPQELADALCWLVWHPQQREQMRERGLAQARRFDGAQLGSSTLLSYRRAASATQRATKFPALPRLALWTPLPPQKSGIADYSAELLTELATRYEVEVFVDDGYLPDEDLLAEFTIQHHRAFERRDEQQRFDAVVYQVGASFFHLYMYEQLQHRPGIVVLHDLTWGIVLFARAVAHNTMNTFKQELRTFEGPKALAEFEQIERSPHGFYGPEREAFLDHHYMLQAIIQSSTLIIVHMEEVARELRQMYPTTPVRTIPMGVEDPWRAQASKQELRERYGLQQEAFVVGVFGIVDRVKRVDVCIEAFQSVSLAYPTSQLVIVGQQPNGNYERELKQRVEELGLRLSVVFIGHASEADFDALLLASDVIVNLRYPSKKQMSAVLIRAIAAGKPTIITNLPEWQFLPARFCWRLPPDKHEVTVLRSYLLQLAAYPEFRNRIGQAARIYFQEQGTVQNMAYKYQHVIQQLIGSSEEDVCVED